MKKSDKSKNHQINQTVKGYIEDQGMEDIRWAETLPALKSVDGGKLISAEKVSSWMESWGTGRELSKPQ
ncbi:MAG: transcriptional regulator [Gammaproteobacteria bacterium]|nr:transcriptional regulator [Gammaproteobacteria bacterium]